MQNQETELGRQLSGNSASQLGRLIPSTHANVGRGSAHLRSQHSRGSDSGNPGDTGQRIQLKWQAPASVRAPVSNVTWRALEDCTWCGCLASIRTCTREPTSHIRHTCIHIRMPHMEEKDKIKV